MREQSGMHFVCKHCLQAHALLAACFWLMLIAATVAVDPSNLPQSSHATPHCHRLTPKPQQVGETEEDLPPLERLLRCDQEAAHTAIADALWEAASDADAVAALERLAAGSLADWEAEGRAGRGAASGGSGFGAESSRDETAQG